MDRTEFPRIAGVSDGKSCEKPHGVAASDEGVFTFRHVPALDGLRGVACLLVIFVHLGLPYCSGGFLGVDIFFVLSGFLITCLLLQEWERDGTINLKHFFLRRILRLLPAQLLLSITCLAVVGILFDHEKFRQMVKMVVLACFAQANRFDVSGLPQTNFNPFLHMWSLSVEDKFYLAWPLALFALLAQRGIRRGTIIWTAVTMIVLAAVLRFRIYLVTRNSMDIYRDVFLRSDALLLGCVAAMLTMWRLVPRNKTALAAMKIWSLISVAGIAYGLAHLDFFRHAWMLSKVLYTAVALGVAIIVLTLVHARIPVVSWILERRALTWTGRISYGLYLWHWPLIVMLAEYNPKLFATSAGSYIVFASTYAVAGLSYYFVERRFLALKPKRGTHELGSGSRTVEPAAELEHPAGIRPAA